MTPILFPRKEETARTRGVPVLEAPVHEAVLQLGAELLPSVEVERRVVVVQELVLPYGRPDVVAAHVDATVWAAWRGKGVEPCTAPLPLAAALAIARLGGRARIEDLQRVSAARAERGRVRGALAALGKRGWVEREDDVFVLRLVPGDALQSVSGVEAKLNNWRRAARQVQSWESHVDAVWLAFPAPYLPHVPRRQQLRRFGLIRVDGDRARIVRRPTGPRSRGVRRALMEQSLYTRWLAEVSTTATHPSLRPVLAPAG